MPEGPEVRRYATLLAEVLDNQTIIEVAARTREAKAWLLDHPQILEGRRIGRVRSRGKHLVIEIEGDYYLHSHLMMWGRWQIVPRDTDELRNEPWKPDRRERARIVTQDHVAVLLSAPIFEVGQGAPYEVVPNLVSLGPDTLPYADEPPFDAAEWQRRLFLPENRERAIGAALLDQTICAGIGNYLRAEILFDCRLDPWRRICDLTEENLQCLAQSIPDIVAYAYANGGATVPDDTRQRMRDDINLVYAPGRDWGTRHWVFRRTNLPCLHCHNPIRQLRQTTHTIAREEEEDEERTRIMYFCPICQDTSVELKPVRKKRVVNQADEKETTQSTTELPARSRKLRRPKQN